MNGAKTHNAPNSPRERESAGADPRRLEKVRSIFVSLAKYLNAKTIYAGNSPIVGKFGDAFRQALHVFFRDEKELSLTIEQYQIKWRGETVYDNREKKESLAFLLYKDGVGEIIFQAGVNPDELEKFVDLIRNEICCPSPHLDIVGKLWQSEFANISYRVFDECADGTPGEGRGPGSDSSEQQLRVNDHPNAAAGAIRRSSLARRSRSENTFRPSSNTTIPARARSTRSGIFSICWNPFSRRARRSWHSGGRGLPRSRAGTSRCGS